MKKQNSPLNQGIIIKKKKRKPIKNKKIKKANIFNDVLKGGKHNPPDNNKLNYEYPHPHQYRNKNRDSLTIKRKKPRKKGLGGGLGWDDGTRERKRRKRKWKPNKAWVKKETTNKKRNVYKYKRNKKQPLKLGYQERLKLEHRPLLEYNEVILLPHDNKKPYDLVKLKKPKAKSSVKDKLKRAHRYYKGSITKRLNRLIETKMLDRETKLRIIRIINDTFLAIKVMIDNGSANEDYLNCIREKLKDIIKFLKKLEECNWSLGSYVRNNGFHEVFAPMSEFEITGSLKTIEAVNKFSDYLKQCDIYIKNK